MTRTSILTVVGARPQLIKAAVVSRAIAAAGEIDETLVHTGQHYDGNMSQVFFDELGIPAPAANLGVGSGSHAVQTARMLEALEREIVARRPGAVLVYGDTNSTLAAALAAAKLHVPVAHVEAGLRSFNLAMPEEVNRIVADRLATRLYTPTAAADANLAREGVDAARVLRVGDVMLDAAEHFGLRAPAPDLDGLRSGYALLTVHRAENTDDRARLAVICQAARTLARRMPVVLPIHPRTLAAVRACGESLDGVRTLPPQGYLAMTGLQRAAAVIATDSGGVQKEAFFHAVPCVTLRNETEWVELVSAGWNRLAPPTDAPSVVAAVLAAMEDVPATRPALYGDGHAGDRIAADLATAFGA